jgi:hypothetical protein
MAKPAPSPSTEATGTRWTRWSDRATRIGLWLVLATLLVGLALGAAAALVGGPLTPLGRGVGGLWGAVDLALLAIMLLGLPSLLLGLIALYRRRWRQTLRLIAYLGPLVIAVGYVLIPHALDPCFLGIWGPFERVGDVRLCQQFGPEWNVHTRFHLLWHVAPTLLLLVGYRLALTRWHPAWRARGAAANDR